MSISIDRIDGEIRDGFYVQPLMKRVWKAELEVLKVVDGICKRHNIKYFAHWGTLLGAVRHGGFIPWDDDMDIAMFREDYTRFNYYARRELPQDWQIRNCNDDKFEGMATVVINGKRINLEQQFLDRFYGCPYLVGIDVFCMDKIPANKADEDFLVTCLTMANTLGLSDETDETVLRDNAEEIKQLEELTGFKFNEHESIKKQLLYLADKLSAMYYDTDAEDVTFMYQFWKNRDCRMPVRCFNEVIEVPFEDTTVPIMGDYDTVLRSIYGDNYMTPIRNYEGCHEYPFFKDQISMLRSLLAEKGDTLPEYFDMDIEE